MLAYFQYDPSVYGCHLVMLLIIIFNFTFPKTNITKVSGAAKKVRYTAKCVMYMLLLFLSRE